MNSVRRQPRHSSRLPDRWALAGPLALAFAGLSLLFVGARHARPRFWKRPRKGARPSSRTSGWHRSPSPSMSARAFEIPRSMIEATEEELDDRPSALNFLAEMAFRRGELDSGIVYLERTVDRARAKSRPRLALVAGLRRRLLLDPSRAAHDRREALEHASSALEDRRRWDGPSVEALAALIDIHMASFDPIVLCGPHCLPPRGGLGPRVGVRTRIHASRGAAAAAALNDEPRLTYFMLFLDGDSAAYAELDAVRSPDGGRGRTRRAGVSMAPGPGGCSC